MQVKTRANILIRIFKLYENIGIYKIELKTNKYSN